MAEEEIIVTKFTADLSELDKGVSEYEKALDGAAKANQDLGKSNKDLGASTGQLAPKFEAIKQSVQRNREEAAKLIAANKNLTDSQKQAAAAAGGITKEFNAITAAAKKTVPATRQVATEAKNIGTNAKGATGSAKGLFGAISQGASQALPGIGGIGGAFSGLLGPIGIAFGAIAGGFLAIAKNTDAGKVALDGFSRAGSIAFDKVTGSITGFFQKLKDGDGTSSKVFNGIIEAVDRLQDIMTGGLKPLLESLFDESIEEGKALAQVYDDIEAAQIRLIKSNAEQERQVNKLNIQLRDRTKTEEERLQIADELEAAERKRAVEELGVAIQLTNALRTEFQQQVADKGHADDELLRKLAESEAAQERILQESESILEKAENRKNAIRAEGVADREAASARGLAAQQKLDAETARREQARAQANAKLDQIAGAAADGLLAAQQTTDEREVEAIRKKYADMEAATIEGISNLRKVSSPNDSSALNAREAEIVIAIDKAKNAELAALETARADAKAKTQQEALDQLRKTLLTETELEREAALQRLDSDLALAETTLATAEERDAFRIERVKKTEEEISKILTDAQEAQLEADKVLLEQRVALQEEQTELLKTAAGDALALMVEAAASGQDIQEKAGKAIIGIFLDTLEKLITGQVIAIVAGSTADGATKGGAPGAAVGLAAGLVLGAIIKGLFAAVKSQLIGNYQGDPYVGGDGSRPQFSGRDGYIRRLDKGERVVTAKDNVKHWDELEAMRKGTFDDLIYREHIAPAIAALGYGDMSTVNNFVSSDTGQRITQSTMFPKHFDANMLKQMQRGEKQGRASIELLAQIARNGRRNASRW